KTSIQCLPFSTGNDGIKERMYFIGGIFECRGLGEEHILISQQSVYGRILTHKIKSHDWNFGAPDMDFCPSAIICTHGNPIVPGREIEELSLRWNDVHLAIVGLAD